MHLPVDPRQIAVNTKGSVTAATYERERTKAPVPYVTIHEHRRRQRVQLHRLIVQLYLPKELKAGLPHPVRRDLRVRGYGKRTLRVAAIRHPLRAASPE